MEIKEMVKLTNGLLTEKYTTVWHEKDYRLDAPSIFEVRKVEDGTTLATIRFQEGPIKLVGVNGVNNEDLIHMVIRRLEGFQEWDHQCRENAHAITKLEEALLWLRKRTMDREMRGVEGTNKV